MSKFSDCFMHRKNMLCIFLFDPIPLEFYTLGLLIAHQSNLRLFFCA